MGRDSFFMFYWLNQHGKEAMLDMPLLSCQLQQHILAIPLTVYTERDLLTSVNLQKIPIM